MTFVAVGGMANVWGGLAATVALKMMSLMNVFGPSGEYTEVVFGGILVAVMMGTRQGLPGAAAGLAGAVRGLAGRLAGPGSKQGPGQAG